MSENLTNRRLTSYNNNRLFIEELPDTNRQNTLISLTNRQPLPAINRDGLQSSLSNSTNEISSLALQIPPRNSTNFNIANTELNSTQQRVKQLESRVQQTETANRALLEEVVRLQNELAVSLRRSFDTLQEERSARQILENNFKYQSESMLQLTGRLKRAEDSLQEDRGAMQSLIFYTRSLEQSNLNAQKDLFIRRDFQAQRLEELRTQIDELTRSKENLERSAYSLLDEIKNLKTKVDMEALNLNAISGDLRNKTRRLEDENRQHLDVLRKQADSMANTETNILAIRSQLEIKINEVKDMTIDIRNKIESDKEEKRAQDQSLTIKFSDVQSSINEEKQKYNETSRSLDSLRREFYQTMEAERARFNSSLLETKESMSLTTTDKVEKSKEDLLNKIKDLERSSKDETDQRTKLSTYLKERTESKLNSLRSILEEQLNASRDELRENIIRNSESVRKLNEGLNIVEKQNDERVKQLEKVISAEIKSRKGNEKTFGEKFDNYNEKFTYAMQSFQATVGTLSNRLNEQSNIFASTKDFESIEKKCERLQAEQQATDLQISSLKDQLKYQQNNLDTQTAKLKETNEIVYKLDSIQIPSINTHLNQTVTKDELDNFRRDLDQQLKEEADRIGRKSDEINQIVKKEMDEKFGQMRQDLKKQSAQVDSKLEAVERDKEKLKEEIREKFRAEQERQIERAEQQKQREKEKEKEDEQKEKKTSGTLEEEWKVRVDESIKTLKSRQDILKSLPDDVADLEEKLNAFKLEQGRQLKTEITTRTQEIEKLKADIDKMDKRLREKNERIPNANDQFEQEFARLNEIVNSKTNLIITKLEEEKELRDTSIKKIWERIDTEKAETNENNTE